MKYKIIGGYLELEPIDEPLPPTPIPGLAKWESNMITYGQKLADYLNAPHTDDEYLAATYYDAAWVFFQIADYTSNQYWLTAAQKALSIYKGYIVKNGGVLPGYWLFPHGLVEDWLRNKTQSSKDALLLMRENGVYVRVSVPGGIDPVTGQNTSELKLAENSRDVAYAILTYLQCERVGEPRNPNLQAWIDLALGHVSQWVTGTTPYLRPFMVGLTAHALRERGLAIGQTILDKMWDTLWLPASKAFRYGSLPTAPDTDPAPDLNLLIAPAYEWQYQQTKEIRFRERGDEIFAGGVESAWLANGKQFNQSYRLSFEYVRMRSA